MLLCPRPPRRTTTPYPAIPTVATAAEQSRGLATWATALGFLGLFLAILLVLGLATA